MAQMRWKWQQNKNKVKKSLWQKHSPTTVGCIVPEWSGWTPSAVRTLAQSLGLTIRQMYRKTGVVNEDMISLWELKPEEFVLYHVKNQMLTTFAEQQGFWHYYPHPPKLTLVLAQKGRHYFNACRYEKLTGENVRWVQRPEHLKPHPYSQVVKLIVTAPSMPMLFDPYVRKWIDDYKAMGGEVRYLASAIRTRKDVEGRKRPKLNKGHVKKNSPRYFLDLFERAFFETYSASSSPSSSC